MTDQTSPKLCINCKHIGRNGSGNATLYKCFAAKNIKMKRTDLVTGDTETMFHFGTCYDARAEGVMRMENCGPEGKWFEPAPIRIEEPSRIVPGSIRPVNAAADLLSQLDSMK